MSAPIIRIEQVGARIAVQLENDAAALHATHLFVATGRRPNIDHLGLEAVGLKTSHHGFIEVNERLATNVRGVWAAGDIRGGPMFTHTARDDYRVLQSQLAGDGSRTTKRVVPYAVFTDPELGRVGMNERAAREGGPSAKLSKSMKPQVS